MGEGIGNFKKTYRELLGQYLSEPGSAQLEKAYQLGSQAVANGLGLLEIVEVHCETLGHHWAARGQTKLVPGDAFLRETIAPFDATLRGLIDANEKLRRLNETSAAVEPAQILRAREEERHRISRELHDELGQALLAIQVNLTLATKLRRRDAGESARRMQSAISQLEESMQTVRRFAGELRPPLLDEIGFLPALQVYFKAYSERTRIPVHFTADPSVDRLDDHKQIVIYRVVQESLTNVAKHAHASAVEVFLVERSGEIEVEIRDNGSAAPEHAEFTARPRTGLGLLGMRERVQQVGGRFAFEPQPGKGSTVRIALPVSQPAVALG